MQPPVSSSVFGNAIGASKCERCCAVDTFYDQLFTEVFSRFPERVIHLGGDEVNVSQRFPADNSVSCGG